MTVVGPDGSQTAFPATVSQFQPSVTQLSATYYQYQADISGLEAGTRYQYRVSLDGQTVAGDPLLNAFSTPAAGELSFLVFGDSGNDSAEQLALIQRMAAETGVNKVVHVGDLAYFAGTFAQFETNYFTPNARLMSRLPFFATPGNHEYETAKAAAFLAGHAAPAGNVPAQDLGRYYSYDWGDVHFAAVDSNLLPTEAAPRMLSWLDRDLAASGKYWKIVFLHHPPYPTGFHLGDPICDLVRQNVNPIVERHGVQLVLTGHEHGYERSFPLVADQPVKPASPSTTYVISGGGGGAMESVGSLPQCALSVQAFHYVRVDVVGSVLTLKATDINGNVIDIVRLNPPPVIASNGVVNAADFAGPIVAGSMVSIFGQSLALRAGSPATTPTSDLLDGVTVSVNGQPAKLLYVSPTQVNLHLPARFFGQVVFQITTPNGSTSAVATVQPAMVRHLTAAGK